MSELLIADSPKAKVVSSDKYNYVFSKLTGRFARWGATRQDDPDYSPYGPELCDIEISSACEGDIVNHDENLTLITNGGCNGVGCKQFCYKNNTSSKTVHMTVGLFKAVMDRMPKTITQIAFGICSIDSNPHIWQIFEETRKRGIVPNVTVNGVGITDEIANKLAKLCGAVAVSVNNTNKHLAYDTVKKLSIDNGMSQVNFHIVLAEDTISFVREVIRDIKTDPRLAKLNALVMLSYKDKTRRGCFRPITLESYKDLIKYCDEQQIRYGFDSCAATTYLKAIKDHPNFDKLSQYVEPCESGLFSIYVNAFARVFACSFCEGLGEWKDGINILDYQNFGEIWNSPRVKAWRSKLLKAGRVCPFYKIGGV